MVRSYTEQGLTHFEMIFTSVEKGVGRRAPTVPIVIFLKIYSKANVPK